MDARILLLVVLNIPVYLFIAWVAFDTPTNAVDSFWDTIVELLRQIFIPRIVRVLRGEDVDDGAALGLIPILGYFLACAGVTYGEYRLIMWLM